MEESTKAAYYSCRITFAKVLKAYAARIITCFLNPPFHKGCCRCHVTFGLASHFRNLYVLRVKKNPGYSSIAYKTK